MDVLDQEMDVLLTQRRIINFFSRQIDLSPDSMESLRRHYTNITQIKFEETHLTQWTPMDFTALSSLNEFILMYLHHKVEQRVNFVTYFIILIKTVMYVVE